MDLHEDILLETDIYPSTDELLALVCEQPFLINLTVQQILPQIKRYAKDCFDCKLEVNTLYNRRTYLNRSKDKTFCER